MATCYICHSHEPAWAWQPFGPDAEWSFSSLGWHYRGFAVLKVCDFCKIDIERYAHIEFVYNEQRYIVGHGVVVALPDSITDGLAYYDAWLRGDVK